MREELQAHQVLTAVPFDSAEEIEPEKLIETWLLSIEGEGKSEKTLRDYRRNARQFIEFLDRRSIRWDKITPRILETWKGHMIRTRSLSARSVNCHICAIRSLYKWAKWQGYVSTALPSDLKIVKPARLLPKPIAESIVLKTIKAAKTERDRAMLEVLYSTGCRIEELRAMKRGDIDLERGTILTFGKGAQERYLLLTPPAIAALKVHLSRLPDTRPTASIWPSRGGIIQQRAIRKILRKLAKEAGYNGPFRPHMLRHSYATHLLDHGADLRAVQELMGHKSIVSTQVYTGVSCERIRQTHAECHPRAKGE